jgi:hypothetical protein
LRGADLRRVVDDQLEEWPDERGVAIDARLAKTVEVGDVKRPTWLRSKAGDDPPRSSPRNPRRSGGGTASPSSRWCCRVSEGTTRAAGEAQTTAL